MAAPSVHPQRHTNTGWAALLSKLTGVAVLFLAVTGLAVTFGSFRPLIQWGLLAHTAIGVACIAPLARYTVLHWRDYAAYQFSAIVLLGYIAGVGLIVCVVSGIVVTTEGLFAARMSWGWRETHLVSTWVTLGAALPHVVWLLVRVRRFLPASRRYAWQTSGVTVIAVLAVVPLAVLYRGPRYVNEFPRDYSYAFGKDRPFAPSLAKTSTNGAFDARLLAGSNTCGTARCHVQIVQEWTPSAHRYAAMDPLFQLIQTTMAKQNGAESTRYCGGCHDPISLFSGTKNIFVQDLTGHQGYQEGVSCLSCHSIKETDVKGNAAYTMSQPTEYLWQWQSTGSARVARDFLIRTYPDEHNKLSRRLFKAPQYCAACHKQFIDQEVNRVGWVQLQNQYDNWANSHWNKKGNPRKTVECRECHMPLVDSHDPSAGDTADYNRTANDGKHRSHRFAAANTLVPAMLKLDGWEQHVKLTEEWLRGQTRVPEIEDKWAAGSIVGVSLAVGTPKDAGTIPLRVVLTSNKVGHDYPTGPLDIIQSWLEIHVADDQGREVFRSGTRDARNFIKSGSFLFKAEPVDQHGNLIDRHNLWEMVGVRFRRALFPGYSDSVEYEVDGAGVPGPGQSGAVNPGDRTRRFGIPQPIRAGKYTVTAILQYRKVDQFLINFLFGDKSGVTAPVVEIGRAAAVFVVAPGPDKKSIVVIAEANNQATANRESRH